MHAVSVLPLNWMSTACGLMVFATSRIFDSQSQIAVPPCESYVTPVSPLACTRNE